ncbi:MAG: chromophore lyase CpcT/CpeT [Flavobacteriales bacterium]|nr:chromophore lyase CpcT/CpeT [Flavobacteriales bacterium]
MKYFIFFSLTTLLAFGACTNDAVDLGELEVIEVNYLDTLNGWMTGSFSSALQAENDSDYYNICLEMHPVWTKTDTSFYLYVEQSLASMTDKPYRQRVYHVVEREGEYISEVYMLPNPDQFTGQWLNTDLWKVYTPDSITIKDGCDVQLKWSQDYFTGATDSATCLSTMRGASYAMSQVDVFNDRVVSWDQGFDSLGVHVWGAEKGGYVFLRNED